MNLRQAGFTLIEVLVALTIVAVSLGAGLRAIGAMTDRTLEGELRLVALRFRMSASARAIARKDAGRYVAFRKLAPHQTAAFAK